MKKVKGYVTLEEVRKALLLLDNAQDRFVVMAIYNGIAGKKDMSDLLNLKVKDVNLDKKTITLADRVVVMDEYLEKATEEAIKQTSILSDLSTGHGVEEIELNMESPYVIKVRPRAMNNWGIEPIKYAGFRKKFYTIKEKTGLDVNASELETSGVINKMLEEKNTWTVSDVEFWLRTNNIKVNAFRLYSIIKEINK